MTDLWWVIVQRCSWNRLLWKPWRAMFLCMLILILSDIDLTYLRSGPNPQDQRSASFSLINQIVNIFGFVSHWDSVITTQFCHYCVKIAIDNTYIKLCTLKFTFCVFFLLWLPLTPQPFKNVKITLSLQAVLKQSTHQIWPWAIVCRSLMYRKPSTKCDVSRWGGLCKRASFKKLEVGRRMAYV